MASESFMVRQLYRSLLRAGRRLDGHRPLKVLLNPMDELPEVQNMIQSALSARLLHFDDDLFYSQTSIFDHTRFTFDHIIRQTSAQHRHTFNRDNISTTQYLQIGFGALRYLRSAIEISDFIDYSIDDINTYPSNDNTPPRLSQPINDALNDANLSEFERRQLEIEINKACSHIKLASASHGLEEKIKQYLKSIEYFPTADAHVFLGWMCYMKGSVDHFEAKEHLYTWDESFPVQAMTGTASGRILSGDPGNTPADTPVLTRQKSLDDESISEEPMPECSILKHELTMKTFDEGVSLCMKHCRVAMQLDPSLGNAYNDLAVMLMATMHRCDNSEMIIEMLEKAKKAQRYSVRQFAFKNLGRFLARHKRDVNGATKNFVQALHFDPTDMQARQAVYEMLPTVRQKMKLAHASSNLP